MHRLIFTVFLFTFVTVVRAQSFIEIERIVDHYPRRFSRLEPLADRINGDFKTEEARAKASFTWIAKNISYDVKKYLLIKQRTYQDKLRRKFSSSEDYKNALVLRTLKKRKGVCGEYSELYHQLCKLTYVQSVVINGYGKTFLSDLGRYPNGTNHAWNAIRVDTAWELLDVTWGAGVVNLKKNKFKFLFDTTMFRTPAVTFFRRHYPRQKKWLPDGMTDTTFARMPFYHSVDSAIEFLEPSKGILKVRNRSEIEVRIRAGKKPLVITYYYSADVYSELVDFEYNDGVATFKVPVYHIGPSYLSISVDFKPIATFLVRSSQPRRTPFAGGVSSLTLHAR
jgi:hypothetical protein